MHRIKYLFLGVAGVVTGALAEAFTSPANPWSHGAWAPLVGVVLMWVKREIAGEPPAPPTIPPAV
jgi:hypothetical protein